MADAGASGAGARARPVGKKPTLLQQLERALEREGRPVGKAQLPKLLSAATGAAPSAKLLAAALKKGLDTGAIVARKSSVAAASVGFPAEAQAGVEVLTAGAGSRVAEPGDEVDVSYVGTLADGGAVFDKAKKFSFQLGAGEVIKGWDQGVCGMAVGERRRLTVPPSLGYGKRGSAPDIPGDATLIFEVKLLAVR
mmetsp:Transcript_17518/g.59888  ORF Transcript_17518/g.59888 Transcript_17518/m.59888 type:complete len:195 (+) Transcript_17518:129-713(+)